MAQLRGVLESSNIDSIGADVERQYPNGPLPGQTSIPGAAPQTPLQECPQHRLMRGPRSPCSPLKPGYQQGALRSVQSVITSVHYNDFFRDRETSLQFVATHAALLTGEFPSAEDCSTMYRLVLQHPIWMQAPTRWLNPNKSCWGLGNGHRQGYTHAKHESTLGWTARQRRHGQEFSHLMGRRRERIDMLSSGGI
ncbi:hypothetical protein WJX73_007806 [Symbiochloris irregularis]|uniref:Uncharacterized protein n=1 Tax=Symbiochloris irregularis TaxID=706552 RepID=A0AAW1P244_9CHLO